MTSPWIGIAVVILLILVEILTGIRIRASGRPYAVGPFAVHKIVALFMVAYLAVNILKVSRTFGLEPLGWVVPSTAFVLLLVMAVSGGWMSVTKSYPQGVYTLHRLSALPAALFTAAAFYLLLQRSVS